MENSCFFIKDFYFIKQNDETDLSFIPPLIRRKLSNIDKLTVCAINKIYNDKVDEIVFSSKVGEFDRLNSIISQYQEFDEVSPSTFSGSVHNYPVSFFTLFKKITIPYHALSSGDDSFYMGLIKAIISKKENVLYVYSDDVTISILISKKEGKKFNLNEIPKSPNDFINFIEGQG